MHSPVVKVEFDFAATRKSSGKAPFDDVSPDSTVAARSHSAYAKNPGHDGKNG